MNILNGFLRGAHDEDITSNVDNKNYSGVAVNSINFVATKRGTLSKRAPFKLQRPLDKESYIISYSYDDDEKYLLQFYKDDNNDTKYKVLQYVDGALIDSTLSGTEYIQPTFTSNTDTGYTISSENIQVPEDAYKAFNISSVPINRIRAVDYSNPAILYINFPNPIMVNKISYVCGESFGIMGSYNKGKYKTVNIYGILPDSTTILLNTIDNGPIGPEDYIFNMDNITINQNNWIVSGLKIVFSNHVFSQGSENYAFTFGNILLSGNVQTSVQEPTSPITYEQIKECKSYNSYREMYFVHKDFAPYKLDITFSQPSFTGLDFANYGNPTLVRVFQQRLVFAGFTNYPRQINISKSNDFYDFNLPQNTPVSTDPIEVSIYEMKSPLSALFNGRQMLYAQSMDGLGSVNSGADDVPLTATIITARLRNETPLSKRIQPIRQDEIVYCVGSDEKTLYALDYDYQYVRIPLAPLNEHCITYFESGIKQMVSMKGKLPYLAFLLNDGSLIFGIAYRVDTGFSFHCFPQKIADGEIQNIAVLQNTLTGYDTLFAVVKHSNGQYTLESIESYNDSYSTEKGREYFKSHVLLDSETQTNMSFATDITFTYTGTQGTNGRCLFTCSSNPVLPDDEIKLLIDGAEIICKNVRFDDQGMWADVSEFPTDNIASEGYMIPTKTFNLPQYIGLDVEAFDGDDFIEKDSEDVQNGTITFKRTMYQALIGLRYLARSEFVNISDASSAGFEKTIENISACITYGTGLKIGTESALEKVGFTEYHYTEWQDTILPDENLRNIPLADTPRKDKRIVIECDFPFPSNITFITYEIKITGVR